MPRLSPALAAAVVLVLSTACGAPHEDAPSQDAPPELAELSLLGGPAQTAAAPTRRVTAVVVRGHLVVTSGLLGSTLTVSQARPGSITLASEDTRINGSTRPVTFRGVTGDVRLLLGGSSDIVTLDQSRPIRIGGSLVVRGARGSKQLSALGDAPGSLRVGGSIDVGYGHGVTAATRLGGIVVAGDLRVVHLGGDATVDVDPPSCEGEPCAANVVGGSLTIHQGAGRIQSVTIARPDVRKDASIALGAATGSVSVFGARPRSRIGGSLAIACGPRTACFAGASQVTIGRDFSLRGGAAGTSSLALAAAVRGATSVATGARNDELNLGGSTLTGPTRITTGAGVDRLSIATAVPMQFVRGVGENRVEIVNGVPQQILVIRPITMVVYAGEGPFLAQSAVRIDMGAGDDQLELALGAVARFQRGGRIDGGPGRNVATVDAANVPRPRPALVRFVVRAPDADSE